jgi:DNA mismatch endonuclease (patch repair protein)
MLSNRGRDTRPELAVRSIVHSMGLRFRVDAQPLPDVRRRADMVFRGARVAVFVNGCFWHGCRSHGSWPKANSAWWRQKLERNIERDQETDDALRMAGWFALRVWEHDDPLVAAETVAALVKERSSSEQK